MADTVAISLGTSYSVIALPSTPIPQVIANQDGDHLIPSIITFPREEFEVSVGDEHVLTGTQAHHAWPSNMQRVVTGAFKDLLQASSHLSMEEVVKQLATKTHPQARWNGQGWTVELEESTADITPKQAALLYLGRLRSSAADYLGNNVEGISLSYTPLLPAFNHPLIDILKEAGFNKTLLISDPAAAALAYQELAPTEDPMQHIMVISVGAVMTSVYILNNSDGLYTLKNQVHEYGLGGRDLDVLLRDHFAMEFARKYKIPDPIEIGKRGLTKLMLASERTKISMSHPGSQQGLCMVESIWEGVDLRGTINRIRWEGMTDSWERRVIEVIEKALPEAKLDQILLAGGGAKTPKFQTSLANWLQSTVHKDAKIRSELDPSTVLALGAAVHARLLKEKTLDFPTEYSHWLEAENVVSAPHTNHDLALNGEVIIPAGTPIPVRKVVQVSNAQAKQSEVFLHLTQGGEALADFCVSDLQKCSQPGEAAVEVVLSMDKTQNMTVVAKELGTENIVRFKVKPSAT
jgi:molecular chaperone HscA